MKLSEVSQQIISKIEQYISSVRKVISENNDYLKTTPPKKLLLDSLKLAFRATKFLLRVAVKSLAFMISMALFINVAPLLASGLIFPAVLTFAVAVGLLRLSGPPYRIAAYALYGITAPIIYIAKTIGLTILDFVLEELGIVAQVKNRPHKQLFEITKSFEDLEDAMDAADLNPSIDATVSADLFSFEIGPIKFNPGLLFRYILDPFDLKNHLKKAANFLFYGSGLEDRARYLLSRTPEALEKKRQAQIASDLAKKNLIQTVNQELVKANIDNPACKDFHEVLELITTNDAMANVKLENNQNWFHLINKIIIADEDKAFYAQAANKLLSQSISPYARDDEGSTAFKNSSNLELDEMVRRAIHGGVPANSIGLHEEMSRLADFLQNSQNTANTEDSPLGSNRFMILEGPPGVGKTEAVKSIMKDENFKLLIYQKGAKGDRYVGQIENRIRQLFADAKALNIPVCIFIDEIDAVLHNREATANQGGHEASVITMFQTELDNLKDSKVVCIGATNYPENIKEAILSRAGITLKFGYPNYEARKFILEDKFRSYSFKDSEMILERLARMYEGKSPRDLQSFVSEVIKKSKQRSQANNTPYTNEILLEDFESVHDRFIKSKSSWMEIIYPKIQISDNKCDEYEIPHLDTKILQVLEDSNSFFDKKYPNICGNSANNLEAALLTGFSAADFKKTIANHNTKCATIYFDAAALPKDFARDLVNALNPHMKAMLVINNIEHVKKNPELKQLLLETVNKGRTIYVIGTTETAANSNQIWPEIFARNIEQIKPINKLQEIKSIIKSILKVAFKRGIPMDKDIIEDIPQDTLRSFKGMTVNQFISNANKIIGKVANSKNFNGPLTYSYMESQMAQKKQQAKDNKIPESTQNVRSRKKHHAISKYN